SKHPVVHFEMPYEDQARVAAFYKKAFGWKMNITGAEYGGYVTAHTAETDEQNMVKTSGAINGGFFPKSTPGTVPVTSVVISVDNMQEAMQNVTEAGGTIVREPVEIPGVGMWAVFTDSEGNRVSLMQSSQE